MKKDIQDKTISLQDEPTACQFTADNNYLLVTIAIGKQILMYKVSDLTEKLVTPFSKFAVEHKTEIKTIDTSTNNKFVVTCSDDTQVKVWNMNGQVLYAYDSKQVKNNMARLSPDGKFIAVATFVNEVRLLELITKRDNFEFSGVNHAMTLLGHKKEIFYACFSPDSKMVATSSKDGTIKLWNIDVRYKVKEDPVCIATIKDDIVPQFEKLCFSPDGKTLLAIHSNNIYIYSVASRAKIAQLEGIHEGWITSVVFSPDSEWFATACNTSDRFVILWKYWDIIKK